MSPPQDATSSDDAPLAIALGLPCLAVWSLFAWAHLDLGQVMLGRTSALVLLASLCVYGFDRWRDRRATGRSWRWVAASLVLVQLVLLFGWWEQAGPGKWGSLCYFAAGQIVALGYAGVGKKGKGIKHVPGAKAIVVSLAVSIACVGMVDAFLPNPDPLHFWGQAKVQSAAAFLLAITGCNAQLFDLRDRDRDALSGVPSAAVLLGHRRAKIFAVAWLVFWSGVSVVLGAPFSAAGWASRAVALGLGLWQIWRIPFRVGAGGYFCALDGALVLPGLVALLTQVLSSWAG